MNIVITTWCTCPNATNQTRTWRPRDNWVKIVTWRSQLRSMSSLIAGPSLWTEKVVGGMKTLCPQITQHNATHVLGEQYAAIEITGNTGFCSAKPLIICSPFTISKQRKYGHCFLCVSQIYTTCVILCNYKYLPWCFPVRHMNEF